MRCSERLRLSLSLGSVGFATYAMKKTRTCPKCGCTNIIGDARAVDRGDVNSVRDMEVATYRKPDALIFREKQVTTVSAWVCSDCGYVEYYADNPANIILPKA
jgi:predicted nucleic-acid-binding Zn-ribbon protein